jgi:hypothetical protein
MSISRIDCEDHVACLSPPVKHEKIAARRDAFDLALAQIQGPQIGRALRSHNDRVWGRTEPLCLPRNSIDQREDAEY